MDKLKLDIEVLPSGAWNNNLRTLFSKKAWDFIREDAYARAHGKCSICKRKVNRLEAHERWEFSKEAGVQKLVDVIAVCNSCHSVIHIGRTQLIGYEDRAIKHFQKVNGCDYQGYISALKRANERCIDLSTVSDWILDLDWLKRYIN